MKKINIRGLCFDNVTLEEAVRLAESALEGDETVSVFTPNAEIAELAAENEEFRLLLNRAELLLPDGAGILLASEILKTPLKEKVAGVDFGERLLALAAEKGYPVFLLGGKPGVAALAAEKQTVRFPSLSVVGTHDGYFEKEGAENELVVQKINESGAKLLLVGFGAPAQEKWIDENQSRLPFVRLAAGLGGSLDVYAGKVRRAPQIMIRARLEWLYRLAREPKRAARMLKIPKYIAGAWRERFKR